MKVGNVNDWHNPHNPDCPQNGERLDLDCTCAAPIKRQRVCDLINRKCVKNRLLQEANGRQTLREFTQVSKTTLDEISALVKREIIRRAIEAPRKGKTL